MNSSNQDLLASITEMIALETRIGEEIDRLPTDAVEHPGLASTLRDVREITKRQREALQARLKQIQQPVIPGEQNKAERPREQSAPPLSPGLSDLQGLINEAALGYAIMHAMAHRLFDSREDGNTADLAEGHLRSYSHASQVLNRLISDVTIWELGDAGRECQCQCPSCGLGVCLCSPHGTNTVGDVWRETAAVYAETAGRGMRVRPPRSNSAAIRAGLHAGDMVFAVDGREVPDESWDSIGTIQDAVKKHKSGEIVRFQVRRASGETEEISVEKP